MVRALILVLVMLGGCGWESRVKKLSDEEFKAYYALKPYMNDDTRKAYLKLKTEAERTKYLKSKGLHERFYKFEEHVRQAIVDGAVQTGWTKEMVYMSWGNPFDRRALAGRPASRSEMLVYRFEKQEDGSILVWVPNSKTEYKAIARFIREVYLDNDQVTEIIEKPGWGQ